MTLEDELQKLIELSMKYRSRQLLFRFVSSDHNRHEYLRAASLMNAQKKRLLSAISKGAYIN